jgi:imidazolonepropionase-like amidohydrolase
VDDFLSKKGDLGMKEDVRFVNCQLIDGTGHDPIERAWVRVTGDRVAGVGVGGVAAGPDKTIDCHGQTLMPGLIDAHTHLASVEFVGQMESMPRPVLAAKAFRILERALTGGFTTVRDAGFTAAGFRQVVAQGLVRGPRILVSTAPLSQTGGHSDFRPREEAPVWREDSLFQPGLIVDGIDQCRWGAREVLRRGADQVKVMASGGAASHTDEITDPQFTVEEMSAIVHEAKARGRYVMAHAYPAEAIRNCVAAGVRTIEHASLADEAAAVAIRDANAYVVPTISIFEYLAQHGPSHGMTEHQMAKVKRILASAYDSLSLMHELGVRIGSGSDSNGPAHDNRALELELMARVIGPMAAIVAATRTNAEILQMGDQIGTIEQGKLADLIIVDGSPLDRIGILQDRTKITLVMQNGEVRHALEPFVGYAAPSA